MYHRVIKIINVSDTSVKWQWCVRKIFDFLKIIQRHDNFAIGNKYI